MSFSTCVFLLLVLVNGSRAGTSATECIETAAIAAREGDLQGIQSCLNVGWDVNAKDLFYGRTALHWAVDYGKVDAIAALIKAGADVNAKDKYGQTALHQAALFGNVNAIALLTKAGADVNAKDKVRGWTALQYAAEYGKADVIGALII